MSSLALALALTVGPTPAAANQPACDSKTEAADSFRLIHVADLANMQADASHPIHLYDANNDEFRQKNGVIPGAVLLTSFKDYDIASTLPQDKASSLVFYCGNTKCMASHGAAKKATQAGYTNVAVMADGLLGWKDAGKPVAKP